MWKEVQFFQGFKRDGLLVFSPSTAWKHYKKEGIFCNGSPVDSRGQKGWPSLTSCIHLGGQTGSEQNWSRVVTTCSRVELLTADHRCFTLCAWPRRSLWMWNVLQYSSPAPHREQDENMSLMNRLTFDWVAWSTDIWWRSSP